MKQLLSVVILITISVYTTLAQSGIYQTASDYQSGTLSYKQDEGERHAIRADIPFNNYVVKVKDGEESHKLYKWDIYGYRNAKNEDFRFYNEVKYKILDSKYFPVYSREEYVVKGKEKTRETRYYFSTHHEGPVHALTLNNLKSAFRAHRDFHDLLDLQFRSDKELLRYDPFYREYKVKAVFNKTVRLM